MFGAAPASARIPRSAVEIDLQPGLRPQFPDLAAGRTLAIGYFTSPLWGNVLIGDLQLRWLAEGPGGSVSMPTGFVALSPLEGVGVVADERLLEVLAAARPTIVATGPRFARGLNLRLERSEVWIDFLDSPAARKAPRLD